jgi:hypothetical protein
MISIRVTPSKGYYNQAAANNPASKYNITVNNKVHMKNISKTNLTNYIQGIPDTIQVTVLPANHAFDINR